MKNGNFALIAAMLSLYAFGDGRVTETSWHGAYDSGDYSDEGFVAKKTDSFDKKTYYWCCKDCGNGIEVTGFDVNENPGTPYLMENYHMVSKMVWHPNTGECFYLLQRNH